MPRARIRAIVMSVLLMAGGVGTTAAEPATVPVCRGHDLLDSLAAASPEARARLMAGAKGTINSDAILWRLSKAGHAPSYLFGTIHVSDERVTMLSPAVLKALGGARQVALEISDTTPAAFAAALGNLRAKLVFVDGRTLPAMLDAHEWEILQKGLSSAGFPIAAQAQLKPWFATMMLSMTDCERKRLGAGKLPLDVDIGQRARAKGVPVVGLETIEGQLEALAGISEADQIKALKATLETYEQAGDAVESMIQRYLARDLGTIIPLQAEMIRAAGMDPAVMKGFLHALLTVRNPRMRDAALPILEQGGAFIAVGALHLIGNDGLVALFRQAGYEVTKVE